MGVPVTSVFVDFPVGTKAALRLPVEEQGIEPTDYDVAVKYFLLQ